MSSAKKWIERARKLGPELAEYSVRHDVDGSFVQESFAALKEERLMSAMVPEELGGEGAGMRDICEFLRELAHFDGSTALAYCMHTHLVAATVYKHKQGQPRGSRWARIGTPTACAVRVRTR